MNRMTQNQALLARGPVQVRRFRVKEQLDDCLKCTTWDPLADGGDGVESDGFYYVAKPFILRRTPFDGETIAYPGQSITYGYTSAYQRNADDGADDEDQVLTPNYFENEEILAARNIQGGTGVQVEIDSVERTLVWEDLNTAGRMWAKDAT